MPESDYRIHPFPPVVDSRSRLLILGTMPSPATLSAGFYYGHPRNRFWPVLSALTGDAVPTTTQEKKELLLRNRIALWDVLQRCLIEGASDSSIQNPVPNSIGKLLQETGIQKIYANGATAEKLYNKLVYPSTALPIVRLPSTSPANAGCSFERLTRAWSIILNE